MNMPETAMRGCRVRAATVPRTTKRFTGGKPVPTPVTHQPDTGFHLSNRGTYSPICFPERFAVGIRTLHISPPQRDAYVVTGSETPGAG